ncbi:hypothetical protein FV234_18325 [Methylobacterium sp. WL8]|nr:hypothetical protein FV234_18325 [Methylobacterium sp. WL8]
MTSRLVKALALFNRKERFWLLSEAVGEAFQKLSPDYLASLSKEIGVSIPEDAWWAFDYHFEWLYAVLFSSPAFNPSPGDAIKTNSEKLIRSNQEDMDLIVAFDDVIVIVEAKLSTSWSNKQTASKARRLSALPTAHARCFYVLTSPVRPTKLNMDGWPEWALRTPLPHPSFYWLPLKPQGAPQKPLMVSKCDHEGNRSREGTYWNVFDA